MEPDREGKEEADDGGSRTETCRREPEMEPGRSRGRGRGGVRVLRGASRFVGMATNETGSLRRRFLAALGGTALVAVCCFTPVLVILLGAVGLGALTHYLDFVLLPALAVLLVLTYVSYRRWKKSCGCSAEVRDLGSREERESSEVQVLDMKGALGANGLDEDGRG